MVRDKKPLNERSRESDFGTSERLQHTAGIRYERTSKKLGSKKRLRINTTNAIRPHEVTRSDNTTSI